MASVSDIEVVEIDEGAALIWAHMRVRLAQFGRRCNVNDLWIAATAASRGWAKVTQDDDFGPVEGVGGLQVVRV